MKKTVYLSGAISGLSYGEAVDWRVDAKRELAARGLVGLSPMRGKEYLSHVQKFEGQAQYASHGPLSTAKAIVSRDRYDCLNADSILVNLLGTKERSIGTIIEIAWAHIRPNKIPIVAVIEDWTETVKNCHEHVMLCEMFDFRVNNLMSAYNILGAYFSDYAEA